MIVANTIGPLSTQSANANEKVVDTQIVDENLLASQKSADLRSTNIGPRDANAPLRNKMEHENELLLILHMMLWNLGINSERDDENSSEDDVKEHFDKFKFINSMIDHCDR